MSGYNRVSQTEIPLHNLSGANGGPQRSPVTTGASSLSAKYATLTPEETAAELQTSLQWGLNAQDALYRRTTYGPNELPTAEDDPLYLKFLKQFYEQPLILLLLGSAAVSFIMGNMDDGISITLAVAIVVTVGFVQEYRSEKSLEALNKLVPHYAHLLRRKSSVVSGDDSDGEITKMTVMASQLVPGDLVSFTTGDRIPADIRITKSAGLEIDESNLTGENEAVKKTPDTLSAVNPLAPLDIAISERKNIAFMGTLVRHGNGQGIVCATGSRTEFGTISELLAEIEKPRTPLQATMDKLGKDLSMASFGVIGLIIIVGLLQGRKWLEMFQIGVSLAVAAIPEGLPIIVTVTLALGVLRMVKRGGIVRRLPSVETLGCVSVVCSDKTGTLTMNHMTVTKLWTQDFTGAEETANLTSQTPNTAIRTILRIGNICNNAHLASDESGGSVMASTLVGEGDDLRRTRYVGQPTDVALMDLLDVFGEDDVRGRTQRISEIPFSSARKWMGVLTGKEDGNIPSKAYMKGAVEFVLKRCDTYLTKDGKEVVLDQLRRQAAQAAADKMAEEGLRVLAFATGNVASPGTPVLRSGRNTPATPSFAKEQEPENQFAGLCFAGLVGMYDPPRAGVEKAIKRLISGGVKVMMITGDAEITAIAIARKLGMPIARTLNMSGRTKGVLRGDDLDAMDEQQLMEAIGSTSIFARATPEHKMKIIRALQARGEVVAMTGDGVNDAPALKMADIGVAMGRHGTDVAKEAADMILSNDDFSTILGAIEEGKGIFYNIQNFLTFQLSTSVAALTLVLLSTFLKLKNPLNAMQILWINIIMDGPPAQSLGVEPVDPAVMTRPPRSRNAQILTRKVLQRIFTSASLIVLGTMGVYVVEMTDGVVTARDTTMTFTTFVLFDMFNALTCRSEGKSILRGEVELFGNKMFNFAVGASLLGQLAVIYFPPLQKIFQTEAISFMDLVRMSVLTSSVFWVDEARKFIQRKQSMMSGRYSANV